ncbi:hypothetical protein J6590_093850, partial [Homalodisca vitripennis]
LDTLEQGVRDAVLALNDVNVRTVRVRQELRMSDLGKNTITGLHKCDDLRLQQAERATKRSQVEKS